MHLFLLILGLMLIPNAYAQTAANAIRCYKCDPGPTGACSGRTEQGCSTGACGAVTRRTYQGTAGNYHDAQMLFCMDGKQCVTGSGHVGFELAVKCCKSDLCNSEFPKIPLARTPNGLKCATCKENDCSHTLECSGNEDRCMSGGAVFEGKKVSLKGCASSSLCLAAVKTPGVIDAESTCCAGEFCNDPSRKGTDTSSTDTSSATSTAVSFLFLVAPVVSAILFN